MRALKFRAWHKLEKRMFEVYGLGLDFVTENTFDGVDPGTNAFIDDDMQLIELMQFIGLKDKNKVDIYEGDIFYKESNPEYTKSEYCKLLFVVEWNVIHCNYFARCITPHISSSVFWPHVYECEVVGNIYKNPELI